jgi:uncharacterized protein (TIGR02996 family)
MDPTWAALLASAKADPDGPGRLVLADWLTENDQEHRADLIRVQYRLGELDAHDPERAGLLSRESQLLAAHGPEWLGELAPAPWNGSFRRGLLHLLCQNPGECTDAPWTDDLATRAEWLESVELRNNSSGPALARLLAHPGLSRATAWDFSNVVMRPEHFRALADAGLPGGIVTLGLRGQEFTPPALKHLPGAAWFGHLKLLDVSSGAPLTPDLITALLAPGTGHLRALNIGSRELEPEAAGALADAPGAGGIERLALAHNLLGAAGARRLAEGPFTGLRVLDLNHNGIGDAGLAALLAAPWFAGVTHLALAGNSITESGAQLLAGAPGARGLAQLDLSANLIGDAGLGALARSDNLAGLMALNVSSNAIGNAGAQALAEPTALVGMRALGLALNKIGGRGGQVLAAAPFLGGLCHLDLRGNSLGSRATELLTARFGSRVSIDKRSGLGARS